jgi:FKBP-type peptidyl-prolyl cis-trans isomerase SlyD
MIVEKNKAVTIHYSMYLENGTIVESSIGQRPWEFIVGNNHLVPGLESELIGMKVGESKNIKITPEKGFGKRDENLVQTIEHKVNPEAVEIYKKLALDGKKENDQIGKVKIKSFNEKGVIVDLNHPLAGKNLIYKIQVVDVKQAL